ncbi:MAG: response regulator [Nitrososphaera sp.]
MKKILLMDDNELFSKGLKRSLDDKNFSIDIVNSVGDAKKNIQDQKYECLILDMDTNGKTAASEVHSWVKKNHNNIPSILISAHPCEEDEINNHLRKGFSAFFRSDDIRLREKLKESIRAVTKSNN